MEDDKKDINSGTEKVKEQAENFKKKADKTKKAIKIFMKLPKSVQIAIIVAIAVVILIIVLSASLYVIKKSLFTNTVISKTNAMGEGTSYSKNIVTIGTEGTWNINISDEIQQKLIDKGIDVSGMSQDEMLMEYLKLNGLKEENLSEEYKELIPYLIKAEIASQSVDLRSASEMYSNGEYNLVTEEQIDENLKNDKINGVVHFKRVNTGGKYESLVLEYIDYSTFTGYINNNNYEEAKKYFSFNDKGELVIATWGYNKIEYTLSDEYIANPYTSNDFENLEQAYVNEMVIDYKPLISKYTVPFEILAALLINSDDVEFTRKVANLGFTTNIEITIFEKYAKTETEITTNYYEYIRNYQWMNMYTTYEQNSNVYTIRDDSYVFLEGDNDEDTDNSKDKINNWEKPEKIDNILATTKNKHNSTYKVKNFTDDKSSYKVVQKITTEDNTYVYGLTLADSWFIKTEKTYNINSSNNTTENEGEYIGKYSKEGDSYNTSKKEEIDLNKITTKYLDEYYNNKKTEIEAKAENKKNEIENNVINPTVSIIDKEDEDGNKEKYISINCKNYSKITIIDKNANAQTFDNVESKLIKYIRTYRYIIIEDNYAKFNYNYNTDSDKFVLNNKDIKNEITNIQSNYSQRTDSYKKTDTKTKEVTIVNSYDITENAQSSKLYDNKDEKFLKAYDESAKAKGNIESSPGWLEEMTDGCNPNFTTIIMYLLNMYEYGESDVNINSVVKLFEEDNLKDVSGTYGGSSFEQFRRWLRAWEPNTGISSDKTLYKVGLVNGNRTVGYGIDLDTSGALTRIKELDPNIDTDNIKEGDWLPVYIIDQIEEEFINEHLQTMKELTKNLNLTEYQLYAMVSRAYNCGNSGATWDKYSIDGKDFEEAFNAYWKEDDDKLGQTVTDEIYNHNLYKKYMQYPTNNGILVTRRKAEWQLFTTGYFDRINEYYCGGYTGDASGFAATFLNKADEIYKYMVSNGYCYGFDGNKPSDSRNVRVTCCAAYVSWTLYESGWTEIDSLSGWRSCSHLIQWCDKRFQKVTSFDDLQPGDIIFGWTSNSGNYGHVTIYAGDYDGLDCYYDGGTNYTASMCSGSKFVINNNYGVRSYVLPC